MGQDCKRVRDKAGVEIIMAKIGQQRRGLSTVVGAVFMILVMVGAINVMLWTMQQQNRVTETIIEKTNSNLNRINEDINISEIKITGSDKLNMTVTNAGGAAATLKTIYIVNETAKEQFRYDVDLAVDGRGSIYVDTLPLTVKDNTNYSIRLITESGNTATASITPLSSVALPMSLVIVPPTASPGSNVTVLFAVTNNQTDSALSLTVTPTLSKSLGCSPIGPSCQFIDYITPSSQTIQKGSTMLFQWISYVNAPDGTTLTFNASLANAKNGNYIITTSQVEIVDSAQGAFQAEQIVGSDMLVKPEIFPVFPGPFGESSQRALWGVVVANPVNQTMKVSRIVFTLQSPDAQGNQFELVEKNCNNTPLYPSHGTWSCPAVGIIMWSDTSNPEQIPKYSAQSFVARIDPGEVPVDEHAFMATVTVFTSYGQFAKAGYAGNMRNNGASVGNVYLTDTTNTSTALINTHMLMNLTGLKSGEPMLLNVTFADLDTVSTTKIKAGTTLIINVPRGFTDIELNSYTGFNSEPTVTPFSDGSHQIVAILSDDLGNDAGSVAEAEILSFYATPPTVARQTVFIMHVFTDGVTTDTPAFSVNAFGGFGLVVNP